MARDHQRAEHLGKTFKFVDLFSGIGGFHVALSSLGGECVMACENNPQAREVYTENHGIVPWGDIRSFSPSDVPDHDVLAAGFPCQAFSKAGSQLGLRDETRGTLFYDVAEIVAIKRPRFVILENVRNLVRHDGGRTWSLIIARLRELDYSVSDKPLILSPHLLSPSQGGAPQFRERVFILAQDSRAMSGTSATGGDALGDVVDLREEVTQSLSWDPNDWDLKRWLLDHPATETNIAPFAVKEDELERVRAWGRLLDKVSLPLPGPTWEWALRAVADESDEHPDWKKAFHRKNRDFYLANREAVDEWRMLERPRLWLDSHRKFEWQAQDWSGSVEDLLIHFRPSGIRVKRPTYTPSLVAMNHASVLGWERRRLTPSEAASLQGLPVDFQLHPDPKAAYRQLGNGVNTGVVKYLLAMFFTRSGFRSWTGTAPPSAASPRQLTLALPPSRPSDQRILEPA